MHMYVNPCTNILIEAVSLEVEQAHFDEFFEVFIEEVHMYVHHQPQQWFIRNLQNILI